MTTDRYARSYYCPICKKMREVKEVKERPDHDEVVLMCGHTFKGFVREDTDEVAVSDYGSAYVTVSFETDDDMKKALYELIYNSPSSFTGVGEREIVISNEQRELLKTKNIRYKQVA